MKPNCLDDLGFSNTFADLFAGKSKMRKSFRLHDFVEFSLHFLSHEPASDSLLDFDDALLLSFKIILICSTDSESPEQALNPNRRRVALEYPLQSVYVDFEVEQVLFSGDILDEFWDVYLHVLVHRSKADSE